MKRVADMTAERAINHLMLLNPAFALEGGRNDQRGIMIAIAAQILDRDLRVGQTFLDQPLDRRRVQRHEFVP